MTVKLRDELETAARDLLGGEQPTPERVGELLAELGRRRAEGGSNAATPAASPADSGLTEAVKALAAEVAEMRRANEEKATDRAVGDGKLPPAGSMAPKLGDGDIPRGQWVQSPYALGRRFNLEAYLCGCGTCSSHRELHFYCSMCKRGPFDIAATAGRGVFKRDDMGPGGIHGIALYACPGICAQQLMGILNQAPVLAMPTPISTITPNAPGPPMPIPRISAPPVPPLVPAGSD